MCGCGCNAAFSETGIIMNPLKVRSVEPEDSYAGHVDYFIV